MKEFVKVSDYAGHILEKLPRGITMTVKKGDTVNPMTIAWGTLGFQWRDPIFIVYVRENRFSKHLMDEAGEFTVNIPMDGSDPKIAAFCGTKSGRDVDKAAELGLHLVSGEVITTPGFAEYPLTLECKVIYRQKQDLHLLDEDIRKKCYPLTVENPGMDWGDDTHTAYYGKIVSSYIIK